MKINIKRDIKFCVIWISSVTVAKYLPMKIPYCLNHVYQYSHHQSKLFPHGILCFQVYIKSLQRNFQKSRLQKRMLKFFLTFHMILKIFFQNYPLNIINAHQSLAKRLRSREQGLGESSGFSHPLERGCGDWWGVVTASYA